MTRGLEAQEVVPYEHLAVAVPARADPDRRDRDRFGDHASHRVGNALEHDCEAAGLRQRDRVVGERLRGIELLALHLESAERVNRLRV